jgi:methionyl-tRNA formyltransferase
MQMDAGLDTGGVLLERAIAIAPGDTAASLHDKLALLGADAIVDALPRIERGELIATPQPAAGVSYAAKIDKREAALDFTGPAVELARRIRAFDPQPGCTATVRGVALKVFRAHASEGISAEPAHRPGEIVEVRDDGVMVATGAGLLKIGELQKSGGRRLPSGQFLRGFPLAAGECFALP